MANTPKTITLFCAGCQKDQSFDGVVDLNGELVFTCTVCGRFLKVPANLTVDEIKAFFVTHAEVNAGQVNIENSQVLLDEILA